MKANIKNRIRTLSILFLSCSFIFVTGCSTLRDWLGYNEPASQVNDDLFSNSHLDNFLSSVRPINGTAESNYRLARYFQKRGKHKFAVDELLKAINKDPSYVKAYNALGVSYDHLGNFDLAVKSYKFALELNPKLDYVYNNLGYSYLLQKNYDAAITAFKKAMALNDTHKKYQNNLELAYARKGKTHTAFNELNLAKNESISQTQSTQGFRDQNPPLVSEETAVKTLPKRIVSSDDSSNNSGEPLLIAGIAQIVTKGNFPQNIVAEVKNPVIYTVQVATSENLMSATRLMELLEKNGYPCPYLNKVGNEKPFYRVRLGRFMDKNEADRWLSDLITHSLGNKPFITFEDENSKRMILSSKQDCFSASIGSPNVVRLLDIEISNGNGMRHMARNVGTYLKSKGFIVTRLTNADHFDYPETKIYYRKGYRQDALRLAEDIPGRQKASNIIEMNQIKKKVIKVLIGKDLIPFNAEIKGNLNSHVAKGKNASPSEQMKTS